METLVHYSNPTHAITLLSFLNEQRMKEQLCDVILIVGDQKFRAHKSVLAASCEYFHSLFARREAEAHTVVQLDFCEPDAFENVLNYIYSSSLFVDKASMAAIQELGYSLGIPYLTNIMSKKPHVTYSVSRKRTSFSEADDGGGQKRSVIVCQSPSDKPGTSSPPVKGSNIHGTTEPKQTSSMKVRESSLLLQKHCQPSERSKPNKTSGSTTSTLRKFTTERNPDEQASPLASLERVALSQTLSVRPQLTTSVSVSDSQMLHSRLSPDTAGLNAEQPLTANTPKQASPAKTVEPRQAVDRSGPLIKSLLRRSLSMDSSVPVSSPALQLKAEQIRESAVGTMTEKSTNSGNTEQKPQKPKANPPLNISSKLSHKNNEVVTYEPEVCVKTEPSSPQADPSDIIQVTIGDDLPANLKEFQIHFDGGLQGLSTHSGKRKTKPDTRRGPLKKARNVSELRFEAEHNKISNTLHNTNMDANDGSGESRKYRKFKCWSCLKVFRSKTGLYRHMNMFHNPEKPYSCDICHKQFHTNFKVWTHCQTQHGILQNPAASCSSSTAQEVQYPRKLVNITQEKEIKKSTVVKYRRNKHGSLQSQPFNKRNLRSRSKIHTCPYCPKVFWLQSLFRQHLSMHAGEGSDLDAEEDAPLLDQEDTVNSKDNKSTPYPCKFCGEKLTSAFELEDHQRACLHATLCPYCGLRFSSPMRKNEHECHCAYKKLTCLDCMRTFKSSFSIWRHQVEVHNQNTMTIIDQLSFRPVTHNGKVANLNTAGNSGEELGFSDSSEPVIFDSEDSSITVEDLGMAQSQERMTVKEEPQEEALADRASMPSAEAGPEEPAVWPCEKCGKVFSVQKHLERHQELLCHIKPFICHICDKAFRTNFRLWSHVQTHVSTTEGLGAKENDRCPSSPSPSPPPATVASRSPAHQVSSSSPPLPAVEAAVPSQPKLKMSEQDTSAGVSTAKNDVVDQYLTPQESDSMFYHAPTLSSLTFKKQYMCRLCNRTFKTAFSLWSHEQSHTNL